MRALEEKWEGTGDRQFLEEGGRGTGEFAVAFEQPPGNYVHAEQANGNLEMKLEICYWHCWVSPTDDPERRYS